MAVTEHALADISTARHAAHDGSLREARLRAKLSQADIAQAVGVTEATVSRWESGIRRPRRAEAQRLAAVLRVLEEAVAA
jgi:transcriptional regulator with XRE-family HTH domain